jgi:hypothetical protein
MVYDIRTLSQLSADRLARQILAVELALLALLLLLPLELFGVLGCLLG